MRKIRLILVFIPFMILFNSCDKGDDNENENNSILIKTEKYYYNTNDIIFISITNNLNKNANHFKCDNHDLRASHILKRKFEPWIESETWIKEELFYACTQMGPMGFWGILSPSETKTDSISIDNAGLYKLKYSFIIDSDTVCYHSNDFLVAD